MIEAGNETTVVKSPSITVQITIIKNKRKWQHGLSNKKVAYDTLWNLSTIKRKCIWEVRIWPGHFIGFCVNHQICYLHQYLLDLNDFSWYIYRCIYIYKMSECGLWLHKCSPGCFASLAVLISIIALCIINSHKELSSFFFRSPDKACTCSVMCYSENVWGCGFEYIFLYVTICIPPWSSSL